MRGRGAGSTEGLHTSQDTGARRRADRDEGKLCARGVCNFFVASRERIQSKPPLQKKSHIRNSK